MGGILSLELEKVQVLQLDKVLRVFVEVLAVNLVKLVFL